MYFAHCILILLICKQKHVCLAVCQQLDSMYNEFLINKLTLDKDYLSHLKPDSTQQICKCQVNVLPSEAETSFSFLSFKECLLYYAKTQHLRRTTLYAFKSQYIFEMHVFMNS